MRPVRILVVAYLLGYFASLCVGQNLPCPSCGRVAQGVTPKAIQTDQAGIDSSSVSRAFQLANAKRSRAGLGPLGYDPEMTRGAQIKVDRAAAQGITGHQGGSFYGGNKEGVGWSSSREEPMACYLMTAPAGTPAGFAMAQGRRGWHSVLLLSHGGRLPSGASRGGPLRRITNRGGGGGGIFRGGLLRRFRR